MFVAVLRLATATRLKKADLEFMLVFIELVVSTPDVVEMLRSNYRRGGRGGVDLEQSAGTAKLAPPRVCADNQHIVQKLTQQSPFQKHL